MDATGLLNEIAPTVEHACRSGSIDAASLAVMHAGKTYESVWGLANRDEDIAATQDTLFHVGSATKSLTAELVWKLVDQGRLSADMPVVAAAPELGHIESLANPRLTLAHLLSHTGGLDGDVIFDCGRGKDVLRRYMAEITAIGTLFAPGEQFSYANIGYGILGRIVEVAGGAPFEDALAKSLRDDHKLSKFAILPIDKIRQRTALHFTGEAGARRPEYFWPHSNIASGTVLAMSMGDLVRWGASHLASGPNGDVSQVTKEMRKVAIALPHNHRYEGWGYGFTLIDGVGETLIGHDGGTAGTSTFFRIAPNHGTVWALAATGPGGMAVYRQIEPLLRRLANIPAPARTPPGRPVPQDLDAYEGIYERDGMVFTIRKGEGLTLNLSVSGPMAPSIVDGLTLCPITAQVCELEIPALKATVWVSFHEFDVAGKPQLIFLLERMARRTGAHK